MIHFYTAKLQPATDYIDDWGDEELRGGFEPDQKLCTDCCGKQREAKDCMVQCYGDGLRIWCAPEKGCKDPQVIAEKKRIERMNRSRAQRARRAREAAVNDTGAHAQDAPERARSE